MTKNKTVTVLLVEDEENVRTMTEMMLHRLDYKVLVAKDGVEALELFKSHLNTINAVLCDLTMPRMDGWETMRAMRQIQPKIPFVLVSGHDEFMVIIDGNLDKPQAFIHKPYRKENLVDALEKAIESTK